MMNSERGCNPTTTGKATRGKTARRPLSCFSHLVLREFLLILETDQSLRESYFCFFWTFPYFRLELTFCLSPPLDHKVLSVLDPDSIS